MIVLIITFPGMMTSLRDRSKWLDRFWGGQDWGGAAPARSTSSPEPPGILIGTSGTRFLTTRNTITSKSINPVIDLFTSQESESKRSLQYIWEFFNKFMDQKWWDTFPQWLKQPQKTITCGSGNLVPPDWISWSTPQFFTPFLFSHCQEGSNRHLWMILNTFKSIYLKVIWGNPLAPVKGG